MGWSWNKAEKTGIGILLATVLVLGGCTPKASENINAEKPTESIQQEKTVTDDGTSVRAEKSDDNIMELKQKYADATPYEFSGEVYQIDRTESIKIPIAYDPSDKGYDDLTELIDIYETLDLKISADPVLSYDPDEKCIILKPGAGVIDYWEVSSPDYNWGNLGQMYVAWTADLQTGEKLAKPVVSPVTLSSELQQNPKLTFAVTEDGLASWSWTPVDGASRYDLLRVSYTDDPDAMLPGYGQCMVIAQTTDTSWTEPEKESYEEYGAPVRLSMNDDFRSTGDESAQENTTYYYGVIAVGDGGGSMMSNMYDSAYVGASLPISMLSTFVQSQDVASGSAYADTILELPAYRGIVTGDGSTSQRLMNYHFDGITAMGGNTQCVPYTLDGTQLSSYIILASQDQTTLEQDCETIAARQEQLRAQYGAIRPITIQMQEDSAEETPADEEIADAETIPDANETTDENETDGPVSDQEQSLDIGITASNALSAYLATNMLSGSEVIDLGQFPEATDRIYLQDAWQEAYYQNPLILGVDGISLSKDGQYMQILYQEDESVRETKQREIISAVHDVLGDIITDGMSDLDKEIAINQYLCDSTEYDYDALENAEKNNFAVCDPSFNDSFNAYGVLVNKIGVCASYAAAFKLLADAAGMDTIVVTGNLNGTMPHAWNRVRIGEEWPTVDVTNNDNEIISNAILNLSDASKAGVLVEDHDFIMDDVQNQYYADSDEDEFYKVIGQYYEVDDVSARLIEQLNTSGSATCRTDYKMDDDTFAEIAKRVVKETKNTQLKGCNWMGVIHMEK